ncbi:MAG: plastocyanin/azurin family copper-binding protein [Solirubrobacteraceae bacterium]
MHHAYLTLLAAGVHEQSKNAFYILGGALAAWAVIVAAIGFTKPDFPGEKGGERAVIAISALLVIGAMASAVLTASTPAPAAAFRTNQGLAKGTAPAPTPAGQGARSAAPASSAPAPPPGTVAVAADPTGQLKFTQSTLSAKAGKVTIAFTNNSQIAHNFTLLRGSNSSATPTFAGGTKKLSVTLAPGKYRFLCSVPGHAQAGMMGTLTVN